MSDRCAPRDLVAKIAMPEYSQKEDIWWEVTVASLLEAFGRVLIEVGCHGLHWNVTWRFQMSKHDLAI